MEENINNLYKDVISIDTNKLIEYLKCSLCNGIMRTPFTINECMHTFCKSCIFKYFYSNKNKDCCPMCETKLGGRPIDTLNYDSSMSAIIEILFPEFDQIDNTEIKKMYEAFRNKGQTLPDDEELLRLQAPSLVIYLYPFKCENPMQQLPKLKNVKLVLQPNMTIEVLKKYLVTKLNQVLKSIEEIDFCYKNTRLQNHYTLKDIEAIYNLPKDKIILHYVKREVFQNRKEEINTNNQNNISNLQSNSQNNIQINNNSRTLPQNINYNFSQNNNQNS